MKITATGLNSRFTDLGRLGHQHIGFTQSGALDTSSHILANSILGMPQNNSTIEVLLGGFKAIASEDITIAITGADTRVLIDDVTQALNQKIAFKKGQRLQLLPPVVGARNYIASDKPFHTSTFLNSSCAVNREKTGGLSLDGKSLQVGDIITYGVRLPQHHMQNQMPDHKHDNTQYNAQQNAPESNRILKTRDAKEISHEKGAIRESDTDLSASKLAVQVAKAYTVRIVLGYQQACFDHKMKARFFNQQFSVSNETSSMGMRLTGQSIGELAVTLYSEGIANGAVQITPDGLPIIMLAERQTIGGYPKLGSIIAKDLPLLGQCRPGTLVQFEECDLYTARQLWLLQHTKMNTYAQQQLSRNKRA